MSGKVKLLFDVEQLSVDGLRGTGIVRVGNVLLEKLSNSQNIDVYPIITTDRGNIIEYLKAKGLYDKLKDKLVYMTGLKKTTKNYNWYQRLRTKCLLPLYTMKYGAELSKYDAYFSLFSPISEVVYKSNVKTFLMVHDLIPILYPDGCDKKMVKKFTDWINRSHPDVYLVDSDYTKKDLHDYKPAAKKIKTYTIYLGAEDHFKPVSDEKLIQKVKEKYHIQTPKYFLAVSEITARKNLVHLLKAFIKFLDETQAKDVSLVLVGPVRKGYDAIASSIDGLKKYQDRIVQTGYAADEDLPVLYSGATVFAYPSLYEGFGLPVLEAMQCGVPVITCDNTSLPEVGGNAVLYVSGHNECETAQMLKKIYTQSDLRAALNKKGLAQASKFSWDKMAEDFTRVLLKEVKL